MKGKTLKILIVVIVILTIAGMIGLTVRYSNLPEHLSQHETIVLGQSELVPGSKAAMRVIVRDSADGSALENAEITVYLQDEETNKKTAMFSGQTNANGTAEVSFQVPEDAARDQVLLVETSSDLGEDIIERAVRVERDYRILLTTDKPIYQPGQVIHLRALALGNFDLKPAADDEIEFEIADGSGNKVFRESAVTSEFGAAAIDFQLASEVSAGNYKITASMGDVLSEKTVRVEFYVLPKFDLNVDTDKAYYLPGEIVSGSVQADYFFGKPVSEGEVLLEGYTFDVSRYDHFSIQGVTDADGHFDFEFQLPDYIAGSDLENGLGRFYLQTSLIDGTEHREVKSTSLSVSQNSLILEAMPEGGQLRPGVENILYVLTSYPDGTPAPTELTITFYDDNSTQEVETGEYGLAEIKYTPRDWWQSILIEARDPQGNLAWQEFYFEGNYADESVLLRPDRAVYRVGESMGLTLLTSQQSGSVYVDIVREGQTLSTRSVDIENGQAEEVVDLTPDMYGTLELHAYKVLSNGSIVRDTRLVVVDQAADLNILTNFDKESYLPGENAALNVQVNGQGGEGVHSALGMAVVDESVFALVEQDPGFAKLYFMLEEEILTPRYELHGFGVPDILSGLPISAEPTVQAIDTAAAASLSAASENSSAFSLQANSRDDNLRRAYEKQEKFFSMMSIILLVLFALLAALVITLNVIPVAREKRLGHSLLILLGIFTGIALLLWIIPALMYSWVRSPFDGLSLVLDYFNYGGEGIILLLALQALAGLITLIVIAIRKKEGLTGWMLFSMLILIVTAVLMLISASEGDFYAPDLVMIIISLLLMLVPFSLLLRAVGYAYEKRALASIAALALGFFLLIILPLLSYSSMGRGMMVGAMEKNMMMEDGLVMEMAVEEAAPMEAMEAGTAEVMRDESTTEQTEADGEGKGNASEAPRLRQYFPETMLWLPDAETDASGNLDLELPVADSITTWRLTALASSQDGRLGSTSVPLVVFQDFFVDLDLPLSLTVGDEISVPVGVFNYLPEAQTVQLQLKEESWFDLLDEPVKEINIASNEISVVYFRIKALAFGRKPLQVTAMGSQMSDAILKEVRVFPDGKQIHFTQSDRLEGESPTDVVINIPAEAIPGTQKLNVKIYPGVMSQIVEGLDSILQMPYGCFEQTSSTTYPNILVMDYLKTSGQISPEVQLKAEEYINLGYQRLLTFEVNHSGGFSLFGDAPADPMLTAYGLQEFNDMSRVHPVDQDLIQRTANWLREHQNSDGSWEGVEGFHETGLTNQVERLPVTAFVVWGMADAGFTDDAATQRGVQYLREYQSKAEDTYTLALIANALVSVDTAGGETSPSTQAVLDKLAEKAIRDGNSTYWKNDNETVMGSYGDAGSLETTALAALAFLRADTHPDLANSALTYLVQSKDSFGNWQTTQATVMSLKAFLESIRSGAEDTNAEITVLLNKGQTRTLEVSPENFDIVQMLSFDDISLGRDNTVRLEVQGEGSLMYQVTAEYYLPWEQRAEYPELFGEELVSIDLSYDRSELSVNDQVEVSVVVSLNEPGSVAESAIIDLGLPPGFTLQAEDLAALVTYYNDVPEDYPYPVLQRYELTGRQIIVYINNLSAEESMKFSYRLTAKFPLEVQTPASTAYDYYNPGVGGEVDPQTLVVNE